MILGCQLLIDKILNRRERKYMRQPYDSDVSRNQFNQISRDLEFVKKKTRPRVVDLYEVFCAILYLLKNACRLSLGKTYVRQAIVWKDKPPPVIAP